MEIDWIDRLKSTSELMGMTLEEALAEKHDELAVRYFLKCVPGDAIKPAQIPEYLREVLGKEPDQLLVAQVTRQTRNAPIPEEEYLELEMDQLGRCALCGEMLVPASRPQVDHKTPVALGGKSELSNYQILCQRCNVGKRALVGWIMGAPFLEEGIGYKLRYCVLTRYRGSCTYSGCSATSRSHGIEVLPRVPIQRGGRLIFDNLRTLCADHAAEQRSLWKSEALARLRFAVSGVRWKPA